MHLFQAMMVAMLLAGGMGVSVLGSVKVALARRLKIDEARVGGLVSVFGFVMIPVILSAGFVTDHVGKRVVLIVGSLLLGASLAGLAGARTYVVALTSVLIMGAGWSMLINVGNVLIPLAFPGILGSATNLANTIFGLGAFLTPLACEFLIRRYSLAATLGLLAALSLVPAVLAPGVQLGAPGPAAGHAVATGMSPGFGVLLHDPTMWLCGISLFFYGPMEASLGAWATTYLGEQGTSEWGAARLLSAFWLSFMASRLTAALFFPSGWETTLLVTLAVSSIAVLLGMVRVRGPALASTAVIAAGLVFGPIFPTLMAVLLGHTNPSLHGRAVGLMFALGGIGWTAIPILIGIYSRRAGVRRGIIVVAGAALGLGATTLALAAL